MHPVAFPEQNTTFLVNGQEHTLPREMPLTYEHLVAAAGLHGHPTVVFHQRRGEWTRSGSLHKGQTIDLGGAGMRFTICHTGDA